MTSAIRTENATRLRALRVLNDEDGLDEWKGTARRERPRTRGECVDGARPCPFVSCRHHLALSVNPTNGSITYYHDVDDLESMPATCSLDVADEGEERDAEVVGRYMGFSKHAVEWHEVRALAKIETPLRKYRSEK